MYWYEHYLKIRLLGQNNFIIVSLTIQFIVIIIFCCIVVLPNKEIIETVHNCLVQCPKIMIWPGRFLKKNKISRLMAFGHYQSIDVFIPLLWSEFRNWASRTDYLFVAVASMVAILAPAAIKSCVVTVAFAHICVVVRPIITHCFEVKSCWPVRLGILIFMQVPWLPPQLLGQHLRFCRLVSSMHAVGNWPLEGWILHQMPLIPNTVTSAVIQWYFTINDAKKISLPSLLHVYCYSNNYFWIGSLVRMTVQQNANNNVTLEGL